MAKANHDEAFDLFEPTKCTIKVRPELRIWRRKDKTEIPEVSYESAMLMFVVEVGTDKKDMWWAEESWIGPREGPEWDELNAYWLKQYEYISRYLNEAVLRTGLQLCYESNILHMKHINIDRAIAHSQDRRWKTYGSRSSALVRFKLGLLRVR